MQRQRCRQPVARSAMPLGVRVAPALLSVSTHSKALPVSRNICAAFQQLPDIFMP
jgi:hypothetical protein